VIVTKILSDLDPVEAGTAIRVPPAELTESTEKVRSAFNRAPRQAGRNVATATDATCLYIWNEPTRIGGIFSFTLRAVLWEATLRPASPGMTLTTSQKGAYRATASAGTGSSTLASRRNFAASSGGVGLM